MGAHDLHPTDHAIDAAQRGSKCSTGVVTESRMVNLFYELLFDDAFGAKDLRSV